MILLKVILALSTAHISAASNSVIWPISWPLIADAGSVPVTRVQNGYGDWCTIEEGPHPGLDFSADITDNVVNPSFQKCYSLGFGIGSWPEEHILVLGHTTSEDYGWTLGHIYCYDPWSNWDPNSPSTVLDWNSGDSISFCGLDITPSDPWRHLHLSWVEDWVFPPSGGYSVPGYTNPFDHIVADWTGYDEVQFKQVLYEKEFMMPDTYTGTWFMPDETETAAQISALTNYQVFQNVVSGAIDIAVSPFSAFQGISDHDSAGVYSVSFEILRQNPITLIYLPAAPGAGNFGERCLMQMCDELPFGDTDEFRAIFLDGNLPGNTDPQAWDRFESAYIVTNSGALDPVNWTTGWDNVWTDPYVNNWGTGICQGAWDTFLANHGISGEPSSNREAFFPDGRYAVNVTAESHGSRDIVSMMLPVDDLGSTSPDTEGIIVDNFLPSVGAVIIYTSGSAVESDGIDVKYIGNWKDGGKDDSGNSASLEYLEELREDLRFFQSLEQFEEVDEIPLPQNIQIHEECFNWFPARSHEEAAVNSELNMRDAITIEGTGYREYSDIECDYCLSEDIGQDPVEFLLEEIARVEREMDSRDGNRNLRRLVYGYIPGERNYETLNMLVIYSEPTMVENSFGAELTDAIWMSGYIGQILNWDSRNHGDFVRDTPSGNSEQVDILKSNLGEYFPEEPDASYAVHYTFDGDLPSEFAGIVQVYIGTWSPPDNQGPRDLAAHPMDGYPKTVPVTRIGYESWDWIRGNEISSLYPQGYEPGSDLSYHWGQPCWNRSGNIATGHVANDIVAEVNLYYIGLEEADLIDNCFYWCGFWMYYDEPGFYEFHIPVVKPDGSVRHHNFSTWHPVFNNSGKPFWMGGPSTSVFGRCLSSDSRYFWMTGFDCGYSSSYAHAYCVDSETGAKRSVCICSGWCSGPMKTNLQLDCCTSHIEKIYKSGSALVRYLICHRPPDPYTPPGYTEHYRILQPPDDGTMNTIEESSSSSRQNTATSIIDDESLIILSNPARETLDVMVSGESGERWKLDLYDISGRCVVSESGVLHEGGSVLNIGVDNLPSGVYILKTEVGGIEEVRSISIMH